MMIDHTSIILNLRTQLDEREQAFRQLSIKAQALLAVSRAVYKKIATDFPAVVAAPLMVQFRNALNIPDGDVDPTPDNLPPVDTQIGEEATTAVGAVNKLTTFAGVSPEKRAEILARLELAIENARAILAPVPVEAPVGPAPEPAPAPPVGGVVPTEDPLNATPPPG